MDHPASRQRRGRTIVLAAALVLLAVNLRTTVASLPPLLSEVERDLGLSGSLAGLITALPVLCMAWFAPIASGAARRIGQERTVLLAVLLVGAGNALRGLGGPGWNTLALYGGMLLAGLGVAISGVVLPGIVKRFFPRRSGAATGAYTVSMMVGAAAGAGFAVPLDRLLGSWQASLATWALPAALAGLFWHVVVPSRSSEPEPGPGGTQPGRLPWRSPVAWLLAGYFALQASLGYTYLAWLAPAHQAYGWSADAAGLLLGGFQLAQLVTALFLPALADRIRRRRPALLGVVSCSAVGAGWLFALPGVLPSVACFVLGVGVGGGFALALVLIVDYGATAAASARLAAMVFLLGYNAAAITPVLAGELRDRTGGFGVPFGLLTLLAVAQLVLATRLGSRHRASQH